MRLATDSVTEALRLDPAEPGTRLALATLYAGTGRTDAAIDELHQVLERQPSNDDAHRQLGDILAAQSRWEEAIAELRTAVDLRPKFGDQSEPPGAGPGRERAYAKAAIAVYQRLAELQPEDPRVFQRIGTTYHEMGDLDQALENYRRALALGPDPKAYTNIGSIHVRPRPVPRSRWPPSRRPPSSSPGIRWCSAISATPTRAWDAATKRARAYQAAVGLMRGSAARESQGLRVRSAASPCTRPSSGGGRRPIATCPMRSP